MIFIIIIILIVSLLFAVPITDDSFHIDEVVEAVGIVVSEDCYTYGWWQDRTIYAKYTFENANLENNEYLKQMTEEDIKELNSYIDNYEEWVDVFTEEIDDEMDREFAESYDFNRNIISTNDYCYIYDSADYDDFYEKFNSYDLYFYDTETETLYYFHNNIWVGADANIIPISAKL